jgi:hypothetical protein
MTTGLSRKESLLLESENILMKVKIQNLEYELETERIRSRHFEGLSQIALAELKKARWINDVSKSTRVHKLVTDFQNEMKEFEELKHRLNVQAIKLYNIVNLLSEILNYD